MNFLNFSKMASWTFDDWLAWTSGCVRSTEEVNPHEAVFRAQAADDVVGSLPRQLRLIAKPVAEPAEDLLLTLSYDTGTRQFGPLTVPLDARKMARRVRLEALGWTEDTAAALGPEVGQRLLAENPVIFEKAFPTPTSGSHKCFICHTAHSSRGTNETTSQGACRPVDWHKTAHQKVHILRKISGLQTTNLRVITSKVPNLEAGHSPSRCLTVRRGMTRLSSIHRRLKERPSPFGSSVVYAI